MTTCVFCARSIGPGEAVAGRPPMAAHASCADAALADDGHWDAIAERSPEDEPAEPAATPATSSRRSGCLALSLLLVVAGLFIALGP